ncbi:MAG: archaemetzincin family Zn-dependent metalloprotease [Promethearchaeota archaeon]
MQKIVYLQQIGGYDKLILLRLKNQLISEFKELKLNISFEVLNDEFPIEESDYYSTRRQYNADSILNKIAYHPQGMQYFRILGIIDKDIFSGGLNFVFGLAMNPNIKNLSIPIVALISITRLREEFYRRPINNILFELRVLKEAIHELGHTFGLKHCNKYCIMKFSNSLQDTDNKPKKFCASCQNKLKSYLNHLN